MAENTKNAGKKGPGRPPKYATAEERLQARRALSAARQRVFQAKRKLLFDSLLDNAKLADEASARKAQKDIRQIEARLDGTDTPGDIARWFGVVPEQPAIVQAKRKPRIELW